MSNQYKNLSFSQIKDVAQVCNKFNFTKSQKADVLYFFEQEYIRNEALKEGITVCFNTDVHPISVKTEVS